MRMPQSRVSSPRTGCSTLTTSAPKSASTWPQSGPAKTRDRSRTRTPSRGKSSSSTGAWCGSMASILGGQGDEARKVVVFVAELMVDHDEALGVVGQGQFPCHADASVQLDALFGHHGADARDGVLGGGECAFAGGAVGVVELGGRVDGRRAGLLDVEQEVGHAVLQGLEAADGNAELLARLQVGQGGVA